ncbi:exosortase V [Novosphingobium ginsenosidimutans]|uniref:Exosortase n=1 Tax=Novosphingobium ginsenosidimutans TaxID=1176536 RepID=A0A5B8S7T5_9SPHN|nr:exosortase V [Novosphingobium ginsenosidimutans]QEA17218.1 exosortase [Novosphingobium ginsenosidimutans]
MTSDAISRTKLVIPAWWPLLLGLLVLAVPTIASLSSSAWSTDTGAHGPIVLATGLWLLYHDGLRPPPPGATAHWRPALPVFVVGLLSYAFGRAYDFISVEGLGLYLVFVGMVIRLAGLAAVRRHLFPLFYLALCLPPPGWLMTELTAPLQVLVSWASEGLAAALGFPIAREGVVLHVAQYQLLVEDACAGLNSLFGLTAISLLYIFLAHRASLRHAGILLLAVIPIAILANIIRVFGLILITYYFGDAAAQGFMHSTTGMVMFVVGLLLIMAFDQVVSRWLLRSPAP